ncbi:hypothetical protein JCGZ_03861 [Jatropha curcas]|uniref:Uncharacterized protein n=1 Tax=Jatropha curcas TaxID=180498 RepID=A0A067KW63_JATCU|nr:hypothetical protein JCGZ_03861 [Jatropha curcas]
MVSMHRTDTDPRRIISFTPDLTAGPLEPLGSEFQDSQPPETPLSSQQIHDLAHRRSPRFHTFLNWHDSSKRQRSSYYDNESDDLDDPDYSEHEPIIKRRD